MFLFLFFTCGFFVEVVDPDRVDVGSLALAPTAALATNVPGGGGGGTGADGRRSTEVRPRLRR